ncbi:TLC domain-containing protein 2-like [Gouania willdenowi]|uniref:TLC domain-containing protein 2-like n=1 Tax=Gouania willdenowi TaxID=441366 RepID=UPI0010544CE6|nr:TLC domain-containing protein 2-like [Gouania willdenowi]
MDLRSTLLVVGGSTCSFKLINTIIRYLPTPERALLKAWKWRNIGTSLAHSALTGVGAALCFYLQPQMLNDLISSYSLHSHKLVAVSTGYFIHDFLDLALNQSVRLSWEVLLHHSMVISCFSYAVKSRFHLGFAVVSLLVEINSVFLHIRQLLLLSGRTNRSIRPSRTFTVTSWLNLGTLLVFRVGILGWMTCWLLNHRQKMHSYVFMLGTVGLSVISTMSMALFYRLLRADVFIDSGDTRKKE